MTDKKTILVWSDVINLTKLTKILTRKKSMQQILLQFSRSTGNTKNFS